MFRTLDEVPGNGGDDDDNDRPAVLRTLDEVPGNGYYLLPGQRSCFERSTKCLGIVVMMMTDDRPPVLRTLDVMVPGNGGDDDDDDDDDNDDHSQQGCKVKFL